jgi:hypothetical protein
MTMIPAIFALASGTLLLAGNSDDITLSQSTQKSIEDIAVPLPMVTQKQWLEFLKAAKCGRPDSVGPNFRLGTFGLSVRRLCDLEVMENPHVILFGEPQQQVWNADWKEPKSLHEFQLKPMLQYDLFARSVKDYAADEAVRANVNRSVDGITLSFSGVLMLAQRAGLAGMTRWIDSIKVRERFKDNTTAFVKRANSIF